jgi:hypothetical protein
MAQVPDPEKYEGEEVVSVLSAIIADWFMERWVSSKILLIY